MTVQFMRNTKYENSEFEMQLIPGFTPRQSGFHVSRFEYSARNCNGGVCSCKAGKKEDGTASGCPCPRERFVAGGVPFYELLDVFTAEMAVRPFSARVSRLSDKSQTFFPDHRHRGRFEMHWKERERVSDGAAWCAALYLLTSTPFLWSRAEAAIRPNRIDFTGICIHGVDLDGYVLFHAAKDLYRGTNHISLSELTDPELVSDSAFRLMIGSFLIRRYGPDILLKEMEDKNA